MRLVAILVLVASVVLVPALFVFNALQAAAVAL